MSAKWRRIITLIIILLVFSGAGVFGFMLASDEPKVAKEQSVKTSALPAGGSDAKVKDGAEVDWDYYYEMCAHHIYAQTKADKSMVGLTLTQFQAAFPDVRVVSFKPDKLALSKNFGCYCPNHYILKRYKDELAVFITVQGAADQEVYLEVPIKFNDIAEDEKPVMEAGKVFDSLEDVENYIENIDAT